MAVFRLLQLTSHAYVDQSLHPIKDSVCPEQYEASLKELFSSGNEAKHGEAVVERGTN